MIDKPSCSCQQSQALSAVRNLQLYCRWKAHGTTPQLPLPQPSYIFIPPVLFPSSISVRPIIFIPDSAFPVLLVFLELELAFNVDILFICYWPASYPCNLLVLPDVIYNIYPIWEGIALSFQAHKGVHLSYLRISPHVCVIA